MNEVENLMRQAVRLAGLAAGARQVGDEPAAQESFSSAFKLAKQASDRLADRGTNTDRLELLRTAACYALECGEVVVARQLASEGIELASDAESTAEWEQLLDMGEWPDSWLVAAVRRDPPDDAALDALAARYWKLLFGRCLLLTVNHDKATDLAQEAWYRVLRARHGLKPGGNFPAYLSTVAANLWRDSHRLAKRSGPMADHRLEALDAPLPFDDGETSVLSEILPDVSALRTQEQAVLALDIDQALARLEPRLRDVLIARFLMGESCAEIGRRYGRTEQTISAWVREAIRVMKIHLREPESSVDRGVR
jgi:RNA polymerase sigma factor (sigma-70 family)